MGILDDLASTALGSAGVGKGQAGGLAQAVLTAMQNHPGGLAGLVQQFEQQGLGQVMSSWIGTGQNLPVTADQLKQVFGSGGLAAIAQEAGLSPDQALGSLTQILPQLIDGLTPNGQAPQGGNLMQAGLDLLKRFS